MFYNELVSEENDFMKLKPLELEIKNKLQIKKDGTVVIEDVYLHRASKNISYFIVNLTFEDIAKSLKILTYDAEAQRRLKDGEPFLKESQVKEFIKVLRNGEDIIGNLVWNLRSDRISSDNFIYNPLNKSLTIFPKQKIYITDGYHRTKSCNIVYNEGNYEVAKYSNFIVHIHFLDERKEKDRFGKINHNTNQLSHSKRKRVLDDVRSEFTRQLIDKTFLKGKVEENIDNISLNKLYTFNQVCNSLFGQKGVFRKYDLEDQKNFNDLLNFLVNFFNYLPKVRKEFLFENEEEKRRYLQKNLILEPIMLYAYMTVAREMLKRGTTDTYIIDEFFKLKLYCSGKEVWFFAKNTSLWVGKILYNNGNSISGYPPQTSLIDATVNALKMIP